MRLWGALLLAIVLPGCSWIPVQEADLPPPCAGAVCALRAEVIRLPAPKEQAPDALTQYRYRDLNWRAPAAALLSEEAAAVGLWRWPKGGALKVKQVEVQDFQFPALANLFLDSRFQVADYPRLMFTKTPSDRAPLRLVDRYIWRMALDNKGTYLGSQQGLYRGELDGLEFYYARLRLRQLSQLAFLVDPARPEILYQLMGYGLADTGFEAILGSMRLAPQALPASRPSPLP